MWKLTCPDALMPVVGPTQVDPGTVSVQVNVTTPLNPFASVTVSFQGTVKEFQESFQNLTILLIVAVLVIASIGAKLATRACRR